MPKMDMTEEQMYTSALALLREMVAVPSPSRSEQAAADHLEAVMAGWGLEPRRVGCNVYAVQPDYDPARPTLLLNAHIDTVRPAPSWTRDPFSPAIEGDRLYGLGSNDCGGGLCTLLQVYRYLIGQRQSYNVVFLASAEEEVSGHGGIEAALPHLPHVDVALVGEPTGMEPAVAEKGLMVLDVVAHGKAGHAARNEGVNAIYEALRDLLWLRDYRFSRVSRLLGPVKMTCTVINAGTQHNVIPDRCTMLVDVRTNELYTNREVFDIISSHLRSEVHAHSFRLSPSSIPMSHQLVSRCVAMGLHPYGSPTLSDQALMPFPSMKLGPGQSSRSHTADEFILLSELRGAISTYLRLLDGLDLQ